MLLLSLTLLSPALAHGQAFVHPGILLDAPALQATRAALRAGDPLKTSAMAAMRQSPLASLEHVANRLQGGSLYQAQGKRLVAAMEFHTDMLARPVVLAWLCKGKLVSDVRGTLEIGYSHFVGRLGQALPHTAAWLAKATSTSCGKP